MCHHKCAVYYHAGECVMPKEGIFGVVRGNGELHVGDEIKNLGKDKKIKGAPINTFQPKQEKRAMVRY